ncbi:MAG: glycosyltransferase family 2 protein [Bacteroidales bacterium]|nr:glycosyltransferase family 2 protein [Bacteroidales bacterium]
MSGIEELKEKLSIYIPTYNRATDLQRTLKNLLESPVKDCKITVLNNCSTDNTIEVFESIADKFVNIHIESKLINLGSGSANWLSSIHTCQTEYIWIIADDDVFDFSSFDDVAAEILSSRATIIQVGAHNDGEWNWGVYDTPRNLFKKGYHYFRYSSFLPCSIVKFSYMTKYMKDAYNYIHYMYPHLPYLVDAYDKDIPIYLSKKRIVTASVGQQRYSPYVPFRGFVVATEFLSDKKSKKELCIDYYFSSRPFWYCTIYNTRCYRKELDITMVKKILWNCVMSFKDKIAYITFYIPIITIVPLILKSATIIQYTIKGRFMSR